MRIKQTQFLLTTTPDEKVYMPGYIKQPATSFLIMKSMFLIESDFSRLMTGFHACENAVVSWLEVYSIGSV